MQWLALGIAENIESENFFQCYENQLDEIAKDFCVKFKNISNHLQLNDDINRASTPALQDLKIFLQQFQRNYSNFVRYGNYKSLLILIVNTANLTYTNKYEKNTDKDLEFKKIFRHYFAEILKDLEEIYERFLKFLYLKNKNPFTLSANTPKNLLIDYARKDYNRYLNIKFIGLCERVRLLYQDKLLSELRSYIEEQLRLDILGIITTFIKNSNIEMFVWESRYKLNLQHKYLDDNRFSAKDHEILERIFANYTTNYWPNETKYEIGLKDVMDSLAENRKLFKEVEEDNIPGEYRNVLKITEFLN